MFKIIISLLVSITIISVEPGIADICSDVGQACVGHPVGRPDLTCCIGLVCGPVEDVAVGKSGTCREENKCSGVGEVCGGFVVNPKSCCDGLECGPKEDLARDIPGKCHQKAL
jgi:hypothetical protein